MFTPASMRHVNIFLLEHDVLDVTVALGRLGVLHLAELEDGDEWGHAEGDRWSERADQYAELERELSKVLDTLEISYREAPLPQQVEPGGEAERTENEIDEMKRSLQDWEERREATEQEIEKLQLLQQEAKTISPLDVSVEDLQELEHLHLVVGSLPRDNLERLQMVLFRIPFVIIPIHEHDDRVLVFAASAEEDAAILDRALSSALFDHLDLPEGVTGPPQDAREELQDRLKEAKGRLEALGEEREQMVKEHQDRLLELWSQTHYNASVMEIISGFGRHEETYLISGWVPEKDLDRLVEMVDETAEKKADVEVLEAEAGQRQRTPILLQNPSFLKPFERIISIFGLPAYDQIDPTLIVGVTFVIMFGMMFGDVGHGLVLALIGIWLLRRQQDGASSLAPVIIAAGGTGAVFGLLFGSLFGREDILPHLWISPIEEIMTLLLVSVGGGVFLLNVGFLLHLTSSWRSRDWGGLLFSENGLAGIALYWILLGGGVMMVQGTSIPTLPWILALMVPLGLILFREPLEHVISGERPRVERGWVTYFVRSFFELFEALIGYFTNSVSFVRLGAFAVAHAALGQVVFIMADLASGVGRWLIILVGTAIIIGFEGMVVGIQALRLEYYEFFDKFFEGAGRPYDPFRLPVEGETLAPQKA